MEKSGEMKKDFLHAFFFQHFLIQMTLFNKKNQFRNGVSILKVDARHVFGFYLKVLQFDNSDNS